MLYFLRSFFKKDLFINKYIYKKMILILDLAKRENHSNMIEK